jgi:antibiotic biosynthesis monooxygenase (ABM) superfamily enzyme
MRQFRFAIAMIIGVYPLVTTLQYLLAPFTAAMPIWQRALLFTPLMVFAMTFVVAPTVQRLFARFISEGFARSTERAV